MSKPASRAEAALVELCVTYGYCVPHETAEALLADAPEDADAFVNAVLVSEGFDPALGDKATRRELRDVVHDWVFDDPHGRGARSRLPRFPSRG